MSSPLRPADLFHGHLLFVGLKLTMTSAVFLAVAAAFGAIISPWAILALPVAVLTGLAFTAVIEAWTVTRTKDTSLAVVYRFGLIPLFLFSGTFFPVTQLPAWIRPIAYLTTITAAAYVNTLGDGVFDEPRRMPEIVEGPLRVEGALAVARIRDGREEGARRDVRAWRHRIG